MSLRWQTGSGNTRTRTAWVVLLSVAIFPVLAARSTPPVFRSASSHHSAIQSVENHDQRPRFECTTIHWDIPAVEFQLNFLAVEPFQASAVSQFLPVLDREGSHFNRPPPLA